MQKFSLAIALSPASQDEYFTSDWPSSAPSHGAISANHRHGKRRHPLSLANLAGCLLMFLSFLAQAAGNSRHPPAGLGRAAVKGPRAKGKGAGEEESDEESVEGVCCFRFQFRRCPLSSVRGTIIGSYRVSSCKTASISRCVCGWQTSKIFLAHFLRAHAQQSEAMYIVS